MSLKYTAHLLVLIEPVLQYLCRHFVETRSLQRWRFAVVARVLNDERARINRVVTVFRTRVLSETDQHHTVAVINKRHIAPCLFLNYYSFLYFNMDM